VSKRVSPTERLRAEVDELFASGRDLAAILEDVARVSVRQSRGLVPAVFDVLQLERAVESAPVRP
jgi:hypothetical protein